MGITIIPRKSRNLQKIWYTFEWGKEPNQRKASGIYTYVKPKDAIQKNYNKEALELLEDKKAQLTLESQAVGTGFIPRHKLKNSFLDYYTEFVKNNKKDVGQRAQRYIEKNIWECKSIAESGSHFYHADERCGQDSDGVPGIQKRWCSL